MKTGVVIQCFVMLFIAPSWIIAEKGHGVYNTILEEYGTMISQVQFSSWMEKSCNNKCTEKNKIPRFPSRCHCDKQCVELGDCCVDYWKSCNYSFPNIYESSQVYKCLESKIKLSNNSTTSSTRTKVGYDVIAACPSNYQNRKLLEACENPFLNDPRALSFVEGKDERIYRNQHCAECHGITEWKHWNTSLSCPNSTLDLIRERLAANNYTFSTDERRSIRETCQVVMKPFDRRNPTPCAIAIVCEKKTNPDYKKCLSYKRLLYTGRSSDLPIKNPHCARCNKIDLRMLTGLDLTGGGQGDGSTSLAILFDFTKASNIYGRETKKEIRKCKPGRVYDFKLKACRLQRILRNSTLTNWTCEFWNETLPNTSDHIVVYENGSIFVPGQNKLYEPGSYRWHGQNVTVCGNFTTEFQREPNKQKMLLYSEIEFRLTLVGFSLSIFSLLAVIITYVLFSELRKTLPGKTVINLAVALLLSQLVFLVTMVKDVSGQLCTLTAVLLHYLYIVSFCWMNVIAFDVARTFARKSNRFIAGSRERRFLFCFLYAWGAPLVLVGISLLVNHSGTLDVGYGNIYYCWITNPIGLAIFFVTPVVVMLLFNIVAIIRVLLAIRRERKLTRKVRNRPIAGQDIGICGKLTAVFGLTWILGLGAGYHGVIRMLYIIFNSLQGLFIMIGFIITKRILNLYRRKLGMRPLLTRTIPKKSSTISTTTSTVASRHAISLKVIKPNSNQSKIRKKQEMDANDEVSSEIQTTDGNNREMNRTSKLKSNPDLFITF